MSLSVSSKLSVSKPSKTSRLRGSSAVTVAVSTCSMGLSGVQLRETSWLGGAISMSVMTVMSTSSLREGRSSTCSLCSKLAVTKSGAKTCWLRSSNTSSMAVMRGTGAMGKPAKCTGWLEVDTVELLHFLATDDVAGVGAARDCGVCVRGAGMLGVEGGEP